MRSLTSRVSTPGAAVQSGWCEVYDFYLAASIVTPWGTTNTLRLTTLPGGISFFSPQITPEPVGTQGAATNYVEWPLKREIVKGETQYQDDKLVISASNVTSQWAAMLALIKWYDTPVVIRKVPLFQSGMTAGDCLTVFSGVVDSVNVTASTLQLTCSSSIGALSYQLPSENMHASCRFRYGDDMCTQMKYLPANYLAGTCDAACTTTDIKSAATFTQDTGGTDPYYYGPDLIDALPNASITASSAVSAPATNIPCTFTVSSYYIGCTNNFLAGSKVVFSGTVMPNYQYYADGAHLVTGTIVAGLPYTVFRTGPTTFNVFAPGTKKTLLYTSTGTSVTVNASLTSVNGLVNSACTITSSAGIVVNITAPGQVNGSLVWFTAASMPGGLSTGYIYYVINAAANTFQISLTNGGAAIAYSSAGTSVLCSSFPIQGPNGVKASNTSGWAFSNSADWGTNDQGYWKITAGQEGMKNPALKPYIQFDFGAAVTPKLWSFSSFAGVQQEQRVRLVELFSSSVSNFASYKFEGYFELPNIGGPQFNMLLHGAANARYWRVCVRSRWATSLYYLLFQQVSAYAGSRHWWADGLITFNGNITAALAGVSRQVITSHTGEVFCAPLPVAPAAGDTFVIQRGCARTFNACCARLNTENYGGFNDLELQNIVNFATQ